MKLFKLITALLLALNITTSYAAIATGNEGGGGDASEERVNEIRSDILRWIKAHGAQDIILPSGLSYSDYVGRMSEVLKPKKVIVGFVDKAVTVNGVEKTCRGFIEDSKAHILCNIKRFEETSESNQYRLIHHEYAGLAKVENNYGAASDYEISSQVTDYLKAITVLKLAVKENNETSLYGYSCSSVDKERNFSLYLGERDPHIVSDENNKAFLYDYEGKDVLAKGMYTYTADGLSNDPKTRVLVAIEKAADHHPKQINALIFETKKNVTKVTVLNCI